MARLTRRRAIAHDANDGHPPVCCHMHSRARVAVAGAPVGAVDADVRWREVAKAGVVDTLTDGVSDNGERDKAKLVGQSLRI
jgi:hypothetical protein